MSLTNASLLRTHLKEPFTASKNTSLRKNIGEKVQASLSANTFVVIFGGEI